MAGCLRVQLLQQQLPQRHLHTWQQRRQQKRRPVWALQQQPQVAWTASSCSSCCITWHVLLRRHRPQWQQQLLLLLDRPLLAARNTLHMLLPLQMRLMQLVLVPKLQHMCAQNSSSSSIMSSCVTLLLLRMLNAAHPLQTRHMLCGRH